MALLGGVLTAQLHAQSTTFIYQGRLTENGSPATGLYDLTFSVWDNPGGPSRIGSALTINAGTMGSDRPEFLRVNELL